MLKHDCSSHAYLPRPYRHHCMRVWLYVNTQCFQQKQNICEIGSGIQQQ